MKIKGITWVGVKADRLEVMRAFCKDVSSLSEVLEQSDFAVFRAGEHDKLEIFGPSTTSSKSSDLPGRTTRRSSRPTGSSAGSK